jgi:uncharacterized protein (UPF0332 family)
VAINPDHLFEQAASLISPQAGRPRQVDIRRAVSAAYYAIFHAIITAAADQFIGVTNRGESRYGLAYRSVDHGWLRKLCEEVQKSSLSVKFKSYAPSAGFGANMAAFAAATLQQRRHAADYDVMIRMNKSDASVAIATARAAVSRFSATSPPERLAFLSLLLFAPR